MANHWCCSNPDVGPLLQRAFKSIPGTSATYLNMEQLILWCPLVWVIIWFKLRFCFILIGKDQCILPMTFLPQTFQSSMINLHKHCCQLPTNISRQKFYKLLRLLMGTRHTNTHVQLWIKLVCFGLSWTLQCIPKGVLQCLLALSFCLYIRSLVLYFLEISEGTGNGFIWIVMKYMH